MMGVKQVMSTMPAASSIPPCSTGGVDPQNEDRPGRNLRPGPLGHPGPRTPTRPLSCQRHDLRLASAIFTSDINKAFKFARARRRLGRVTYLRGGDSPRSFGCLSSRASALQSLHAFYTFTQVKTT